MSENNQSRQGGSYTKDPKTGIRTLVSRTEDRSKLPQVEEVLAPTPKPKTKEVNDGTL